MRTGEPAKNGDSLLCPKERFLRRVDRAGCPHFSPPPLEPGVFMSIVVRNVMGTIARAAERLVSIQGGAA